MPRPRPDRRHHWLLALAALVLLLAWLWTRGPGDSFAPYDASPVWTDSERVSLLVDLDDRIDDAELRRILASLPGEPRPNSEWSGPERLYRVDLPRGEAIELAARLDGDARVEHVEPEYVYEAFGGPDDPLFQFQWNFDQIHAADAWDTSRGERVIVAVIDTGVETGEAGGGRHRSVRDLGGTAFVDGWDFVDDDESPNDEHGHGTHVAGTIAQTTNNGYGVAGVAPGATLMPIRVLDAQGRGSTADIAEAIRWAADNDADVINMSLGGPFPSSVMNDAIQYAVRHGVVVIAAAGNNGWSAPSFPAAYPNVVSVAATQFDRTTTFYSNHGRTIDIAAPGGNTRVDQNGDGRPDGVMQETITTGNIGEHEFALYMGTSMASPHVAGVAALVVAGGVSEPDAVARVLYDSASQEVPSYQRDRYGAGLVDADAAAKYTTRRQSLPSALAAAFLALAAVAFARARGLAAAPSAGAAVLAAVAMASGLALPFAIASSFGAGAAPWAPFAASPLIWPASLAHGGWWANLLLLSAVPALALFALFGHLRGPVRSGLLVGAMAGVAAALFAQAIAPAHDVAGVPGAGLADQIWLALNGIAAAAVTMLGARRD